MLQEDISEKSFFITFKRNTAVMRAPAAKYRKNTIQLNK